MADDVEKGNTAEQLGEEFKVAERTIRRQVCFVHVLLEILAQAFIGGVLPKNWSMRYKSL